VSGSLEGRYIEHVGHLHEHFVDPIRIRAGRYLAPTAPGNSMEMLAESRQNHSYPDAPVWSDA
jgi:L-fuconate dehydratase